MQEGRWKLQHLHRTFLVWRWRCVCITSNHLCDGILKAGLPIHFEVTHTPSPTHCHPPRAWFYIWFKNTYNHAATGRGSAPSSFTHPRSTFLNATFWQPCQLKLVQANRQSTASKWIEKLQRVWEIPCCLSGFPMHLLLPNLKINMTRQRQLEQLWIYMYFIPESSAWSSLQRWILEKHLLHH